jgi:hypothetical protein
MVADNREIDRRAAQRFDLLIVFLTIMFAITNITISLNFRDIQNRLERKEKATAQKAAAALEVLEREKVQSAEEGK